MKYDLVSDNDMVCFITKMRRVIEEGWMPQGSVAIAVIDDELLIVQPVMKERT